MEEFDKKYYKIKDVSELLGVPQSTLRYWESEFPQISPVRSRHNLRYYRPKDIETLRVIHYLLKVKGLKIDAAKEQMRVNSGNMPRQLDVIDRLEDMRSRLLALRRSLSARTDDKL